MNKQTVVHSYNETLLSNKEVHTTDTCKSMDESAKYYVKERKPDTRV